jgi:hypothetical protein
MIFLINVVIAIATLWNAWEDHPSLLEAWRSAEGAEKRKASRKLFLLWLVPVLSILLIPLTWSAETEAERTVAELKSSASSNELARVVLEKEVETLRNQNLELKQIVQWRDLSTEQESDMADVLQKNPGEIDFLVVIPDPETLHFATKLVNLFVRCGWKVSWRSQTYQEMIVFGVYVPGSNDTGNVVRSAFSAGRVEFRNEDIPTEPGPRMTYGWGRGSPSVNALRVLIAPKPVRQ